MGGVLRDAAKFADNLAQQFFALTTGHVSGNPDVVSSDSPVLTAEPESPLLDVSTVAAETKAANEKDIGDFESEIEKSLQFFRDARNRLQELTSSAAVDTPPAASTDGTDYLASLDSVLQSHEEFLKKQRERVQELEERHDSSFVTDFELN